MDTPYSIRYFRQHLSEILDATLTTPVKIQRGKDVYTLSLDGVHITANEPPERVHNRVVESVDRVHNNVEVSAPSNQLAGEIVLEQPEIPQAPPCCSLHKPCQHWAYNPEEYVWVNSVTGEKREAYG